MRAAALALLLAAPASASVVRFKTSDGWTISGEYHAAAKGRPVAILVHGVAAGRGEWWQLVPALQERGYGTLAVDLRGHGDSTAGPAGRRTYADFDAGGEWAKTPLDVLAAARYLAARGVPQSRLVLIGGSIGANACAEALAKLPKARALVLLSPGMEYRGLALPRFDGSKAILAASPDDGYAYATVQRVGQVLPAAVVLPGPGGHGAQMLKDPKFVRRLLAALDAKTR